MELTQTKDILEIPSCNCGTRYSITKCAEPTTLETTILRDFGHRGLYEFQNYYIELNVAVNTGYLLHFTEESLTSDNIIYTFKTKGIMRITSKKGPVAVDFSGDFVKSMVTMDLPKGNISSGYKSSLLRLLFQFPK